MTLVELVKNSKVEIEYTTRKAALISIKIGEFCKTYAR